MTDKLRFKDENGLDFPKWEEKKLGEYSYVQGGYAFKSNDFSIEGIPIIRISNIKDNFIDISNSDTVYYNSSDIDSKYHIKQHDIVIAMSGATTGKIGTYNGEQFALLNQRVGLFKTINKEKLYYNFLKYLLEIKEYATQLKAICVAGAQPNISSIDIENMQFKFPCVEEQQKIADLLSTVDDKIENQKEIVKNLEEIKKGLIQKIFSKEIRFKDDNGLDYPEWEEKKIEDLCIFLKGNDLSKNDLGNKGFSCIHYGELYTRYKETISGIHSKTTIEIKKPMIGIRNDILMPSSGESALDIATASCLLVDNVILGGGINILRPIETNGVFLSYQINYFKNREIAKLSQGNSIVHIYNDSLKELSILCPHKEEQNKIADFLYTLDKKIETEKSILNDWIDVKKSLLQRMF